MSLPKGYKRLEYIQSSGTQYIDSLFTPNQDTRVVVEAEFAVTSAVTSLFGARSGNKSNDYSFGSYSNYYRSHYGTVGSNFDTSIVFSEKFKIDKNKNITTIGESNTLTAAASEFTCPSSMTLFTFSDSSGARTEYCATAKFYSCQIYDNGTLVRDFIPCQNASGAVGMWDAVNSVFYGNAGTGTFTAGLVVPEIVDESEITELEYIQSSGTQYFKTGFVPNQDARIKIKYQTDQTSAGGVAVVDSSWTSNAFGIWVNAAGYGASVYNQVVMYGDDPIEIDFNKNKLYKNGNLFWTGTESTFECPSDLSLMALNRNGAMQEYTTGKVFFCMLFDNGLLKRDFVPAMLSNGEVGLYDRVFHEFYRNAGTGEFIAGPEMVHERYTELEYVESDGTQYADTEFAPNSETRVVVDVMPLGIANYCVFGYYNSESDCYRLFNYGSSVYLDLSATGNRISGGSFAVGQRAQFSFGNRYVEDMESGEIIISGSTLSAFQKESSLCINGNSNYSSNRWYGCQINDNGTEVRIYIPMLHPSGVAGLWDSVNERFYASATTTDFLAGPEAQTVPKAPANFRVESETDTLVALAWDPMEGVLGYRLYRQGRLLADTTEPFVSVTVEPFAGAVFSLTAYNENGEGKGTSLTYMSIPENPLLYLITDRTAQDVAELNPKGYYAASDLNRVGYAMDYLANIIRGYGYTLEVDTKTDWTDWDWKLTGEMVKYLQSLNNLKAVFSTLVDLPETMEKINYVDANNIEQLLLTIDETVARVVAGFTRANAFALRSGAKGLPASQSDRGRNWGELDAMETTWANWQLATWYLLLYGNLKAEGVVT